MGKKKNGDVPWWFILGLIFAGGFILSKILIEEAKEKLVKEKEYFCPACGAPISYGARQCPYCKTGIKWVRKK